MTAKTVKMKHDFMTKFRRIMMKSKTVYGDLLNLVKKKSGYYKKDIKPILKAFLKVIRAELQKGKRIL